MLISDPGKNTLKKILTAGEKFDSKARKTGRLIWRKFFNLMIIIIILFTTSVWLNVHDHRTVVGWITLGVFFISIFALTNSDFLITLAEISFTNNVVPEKINLNIDDTVFVTVTNVSKKVIGFFLVVFAFLAAVPIRDNVHFFLFTVAMAMVFVIMLNSKKEEKK